MTLIRRETENTEGSSRVDRQNSERDIAAD